MMIKVIYYLLIFQAKKNIDAVTFDIVFFTVILILFFIFLILINLSNKHGIWLYHAFYLYNLLLEIC